MTIEWALLLSVVVVCLTVLVLFKQPDIKKEIADLKTEFTDKMLALDSSFGANIARHDDTIIKTEARIRTIFDQISKIQADHESVAKTAEETKKLLSQGNLAMGFIPRKQR